MSELLSLLNNAWSAALVVIFFGGSIFVHELGHFLAAKWRGLQIDRFSIGFGPRICSWTRNGIEYRLSWLPLGGYVALPQLGEMQAIEGDAPAGRQLPPISFSDKFYVAVAGAVFNVLFAFLLASVLYFTGLPSDERLATTEIGHVSQTLTTENGSIVTSPALKAGLKEGDLIKSIDGTTVRDWSQVQQAIALSAGRSDSGHREIAFQIQRGTETLDLVVQPIISADMKTRQVGISSGFTLILGAFYPNSPAEKAGLKEGDILLEADGTPIRSFSYFREYTENKGAEPIALKIQRGAEILDFSIAPESVIIRSDGQRQNLIGLSSISAPSKPMHKDPFTQVSEAAVMTWNTLTSLLNRNSDIGINHVSGPAGIVRIIYSTAQYNFLYMLWIIVVINVNLAVFNLLPIPVLDGGHIVFALIAKLRGKALPANFIAGTQGSFMVLLFGMIIYVTYFDFSRMATDSAEERDFQTRYVTPKFGEPTTP